MKKLVLVVACWLLLVGCVKVPASVVMKNPQTGDTVYSSHPTYSSGSIAAIPKLIQTRQMQKDLIDALESQGYQKVWESKRGL